MRRASLALAALAGFATAAFGGRTALQLRRHGDSGWRMARPSSGGEGLAQAAMAASAVALAVAPVLPLLGSGRSAGGGGGRPGRGRGPTGPVATPAGLAGAALAVGGGVLTLVAQGQMGASWRIGVDPAERTALVDHGLYRSVRNPIFTGMLAFAAGEALLVPTRTAAAGAALLTAAVEYQVRRVEEPVLLAAHGDAYRSWAATAGRFVPGVGRLGRLGDGAPAAQPSTTRTSTSPGASGDTASALTVTGPGGR